MRAITVVFTMLTSCSVETDQLQLHTHDDLVPVTGGTISGDLAVAGSVDIWIDDAASSNVTTLLTLGHTTSGTPAVGIGSGISFAAERSDGTAGRAALIRGFLTDLDSSEGGVLSFSTRDGQGGPDDDKERMRIDIAGNVGIGTTAPLTTVHVSKTNNREYVGADAGDVYLTQAALLLEERSSTDSISSPGTGIHFLLGDNAAGHAAIFGIRESANLGALSFLTGSGSAMTERLRISSEGTVHIGASVPRTALKVDGYMQLGRTSGRPPDDDCNDAAECGRMIVDPSLGELWVCVDAGWRKSTLSW